MEIVQISSFKELEEAYGFVEKYLLESDKHPRDINYYARKLSEHPELMLKATIGNNIVGVVLGSVDDDHILIGELVVHPNHRRQYIGSSLIKSLEENSKITGINTLLLGAGEEAEAFYLKQGYTPKLFIQVQGNNAKDVFDNFIKDLSIKYRVSWKEDKDDKSKAVIETQTIDKDLQQKADGLPNCHSQYLFSKTII